MPSHADPELDRLREESFEAQTTYQSRVSDRSDAAEELTEMNDAAERYEVACAAAGTTPDYNDE